MSFSLDLQKTFILLRKTIIFWGSLEVKIAWKWAPQNLSSEIFAFCEICRAPKINQISKIIGFTKKKQWFSWFLNSLGFAPQSRIKGFGAAPRLELKVSVQLLRPIWWAGREKRERWMNLINNSAISLHILTIMIAGRRHSRCKAINRYVSKTRRVMLPHNN